MTETRAVAKSGSGLSDIVTTASYDSSCSNPATCNQPNSVTDARGNTTDYTYDATHGGVLTVTAPAPTSGATRPQTRYAYTLDTGTGVYNLTAVSACSSGTAPSCVGTANESRTVIAYDANGNVTSTTQQDGTGSLSATTGMTYDALGNLLTVDGPLSGTADTTRYRYNAARQVVGVVGPDPDGAGSLHNRAVRTTYTNGLPTKVEAGTVNSQSDSDWSGFSSLQEVQQDYDANARPTVQRLVSGGTTYQLTQTGYDSLGRVQCVAQRMNPAIYGALPSSACTLGTAGSYGDDRITRTSYDSDSRINLVQTGYGVTGVQADEVTTTYTNNGQVESVTDAMNNRTGYVYDGFDRVSRRNPPASWQGSGYSDLNSADWFSYDANGNVTSHRQRDFTTIGYTYDALNRLTAKDLPGSEPDVTYSYDLLSRLSSAATSAQTLSYTYDALGRRLTETAPHGTVSNQYDAAGRRTRLTWPDGFYVSYDYLVTGEMNSISDNASPTPTTLVTFGYDDLGRRTSLGRANGATTGYGYDAVSRLASLTQDLAGTGDDLTLTYGYNPAGQIASRTSSNDAYRFTFANTSRADNHNGRNEIDTTGGGSVSHDGRGNITYDPIANLGYGYSSENLLTSVSWASSGTLTYDPLTRLYDAGNGSRTSFVYDGDRRVAEYYSSGSQIARYVFGPGMDEPLVAYETSSLNRRFVHADERGSVIAQTDDSGNLVSRGTYDEYGQAGSYAGRFAFTGQPFETVSDMHYYRNRFFSSRLGRFVQADPIGFGGGMNLYAYVLNDPVNLVDPLGLDDVDGDGKEDLPIYVFGFLGTTIGGSLGAALGFPHSSLQLVSFGLDGAAIGGGSDVSDDGSVFCPAVPFTITGIGPNQANSSNQTAISHEPGNQINPRGGGVAINPENFGVPNVAGARGDAFADVRFYPDWSEAVGPSYVPQTPPGLPAAGPYRPIDAIPRGQRHEGNQIDLYRYSDQAEAFQSTRTVPIRTFIPPNRAGLKCPR